MKIFNKYTKYLVGILIAIVITACGGGNCNTSTSSETPGQFSGSYTFNNGDVLTGTVGSDIYSGSESTYSFKLTGSTPFAIQLSAVPSNTQPNSTALQSESNQLSGSFNPEILQISSNVSESSSTLTVAVPTDLPPGTYYLKLYANPIGSADLPANTYLGYIKFVVSKSKLALINASPATFTLTYESQTMEVILTNNGLTEATGLTLPASISPLNPGKSTCGATLAVDASCIYYVSGPYSTPPVDAGTTSFFFNYNNGEVDTQSNTVNASWTAYTSG